MASVFKRGGRFYVKVRGSNGKTIRRVTTARTKGEALALGRELEQKVERQRMGLDPLPTLAAPTLGQICEWWLRKHCPPSAKDGERLRLGKHILAHPIAKKRLSDLRPFDLDDRFLAMEAHGAAPASVNKLRSILSAVINKATASGVWSGGNPLDKVPARAVPRRAYVVLKAGDVQRVLAEVPDEWRGEFAVAIYTGMRKGEILGLAKRDVDLEAMTIMVARSYSDGETTKGRRAEAIPIAPELAPYLATALESPGPWLFPGRNGKPRTKEADPHKILRTALGRAGFVTGWHHTCRRCTRRGIRNGYIDQDPTVTRCPTCAMQLWVSPVPVKMRFHDLRHSTATILLSAGYAPQQVARLLRHASVKTTVDIYSHLDVEAVRPILAGLAFEGPKQGPTRVQARIGRRY